MIWVDPRSLPLLLACPAVVLCPKAGHETLQQRGELVQPIMLAWCGPLYCLPHHRRSPQHLRCWCQRNRTHQNIQRHTMQSRLRNGRPAANVSKHCNDSDGCDCRTTQAAAEFKVNRNMEDSETMDIDKKIHRDHCGGWHMLGCTCCTCGGTHATPLSPHRIRNHEKHERCASIDSTNLDKLHKMSNKNTALTQKLQAALARRPRAKAKAGHSHSAAVASASTGRFEAGTERPAATPSLPTRQAQRNGPVVPGVDCNSHHGIGKNDALFFFKDLISGQSPHR